MHRSSLFGITRWRLSQSVNALLRKGSNRSVHTGLRSFPAWFVRGGTSNGLVIRHDALPRDESQWKDILPAAMGSGDAAYGRQLDGMGSGVSSTAKIVILAPGSEANDNNNNNNSDVVYTIIQAGVRDCVLDTAGNCGNMTAIVGPVAWDMGYIADGRKQSLIETDSEGIQWATIRAYNTNTNKTIALRFRVTGSPPVYCPRGDYTMAGVSGSHSCITMSFLDPAGAKTGKALPTGRAIDTLTLDDGSQIEASLVDVGNPGVFIAATSVGFPESGEGLTPQHIERNIALKERLESIRRAGASAMGMNPETGSVPKVVLLLPSTDKEEADIRCLAMSMGQAHQAVPLTLALCLGASVHISGTLASGMVKTSTLAPIGDGVIRIRHPGGVVDVGTTMASDGEIIAAQLLRTGRVLMKGEVYY